MSVSEGWSRWAGRGSCPWLGPRPAHRRDGDPEDDTGAEDHPRQGRAAGAGPPARQCQPGLQNAGLLARQLLSLQGALRQRRRTRVGRDQPAQAGAEEPHAGGGRRGGGGDRHRATRLGSGAGGRGGEAAGLVHLARRRALRLAAPGPIAQARWVPATISRP
jgi:hypothetical protein